RIVDSGPGPLFLGQEEEGDLATGYVYVLRSRSDHPFVAQNRDVIHKIGVTGGNVKSRVANARKDPTYLLAEVEVVATFKLANINRKALEALLHRFFGNARLDLELKDRFGGQVEPREWFLVPLAVIDEAIQKLKDGTLDGFRYDPKTAGLTPVVPLASDRQFTL
ncbi:MAG: GIY-YIG nuclease family protein, partial [Thermoguttaceae bacterium]